MKSRLALCAGLAAGLFLAASCASAPKAAEQPAPVPAAPAPKPAPAPAAAAAPEPAPDELRAKATALRKDAFDLGLKDLGPDEYGIAEKAYQSGNAGYGSDNKASAAAFSDAAARFDALIVKLLPQLADARQKKAEEMRAAAAAKGAADLFAAQLAEGDSGFSKSLAMKGSGDFRGAIAGFMAAAKDFEVVYKLCGANAARKLIVDRDFAKWDVSNWNLAEAKYASAQAAFSGDPQTAGDETDEALLRYAKVLENAREYYMADRKSASEAERDRARGIKTEVAAKDDYAAAAASYEKAEAEKAAKHPDEAARLYGEAAASFTAAYGKAKVKMDGADSELDSLDAALKAKGAAIGGRK